uniref:Phosphomethylpyrimidine synthase n=1 Tax=candidate division WOR-3 bacterium TaxID=2052148 RepID=A0A7V3PUY3_UNCW3
MNSKILIEVARQEGLTLAALRNLISTGRVVLLKNRRHKIKPLAVGERTRVKVNANIGTSPDRVDIELEMEKLRVAIAAGADTVMDLSVGGDVDAIRQEVVANAKVPVGTVPIYQVALEQKKRRHSFSEAKVRDIFRIIEKHLMDGVDFITVHCGVTKKNIEILSRYPRLCGVVSRGGVMMIEWMAKNYRENPLYEYYDELLELAKDYNATLSLGDGLRPGALADATDEAQIRELVTIGELVQRARAAGVQVMVEGPGHIPLDQIQVNVQLEKTVCDGAPFYVLGPLVTDIACGYDHINGAIGGALAAWYGADFLCYVTPSEHLGLPDIEDVRDGVIAARIAAHAADIARRQPGAIAWDHRISKFRAGLKWEEMINSSIDPERARAIFSIQSSHTKGACTMCGEFCAVKKTKETLYGN